MSGTPSIDLSQLPPPNVVEDLDYEAILAARKARMRELLDAAQVLPDWNPDLESDPIVISLQESAFREVLLRQRVNDSVLAVLIATATGADLDHIAARFHVTRQVVDAGDPTAFPPVPPTYETDERLRVRILLAYEALSVAGPVGAYEFHTLSADTRVANVAVDTPTFQRWAITPEAAALLPADAIVLTVLDDVGLPAPMPGDVAVTIMSNDGNGTPAQDLLDIVMAALSDQDIRPITDRPIVRGGENLDYVVSAELTVEDGPDQAVVLQAASDTVMAFTVLQKVLGGWVTIDGLHKALRVAGVRKVNLISPADDIMASKIQFPNCTGITITAAGA